jgi:hypothetical protein
MIASAIRIALGANPGLVVVGLPALIRSTIPPVWFAGECIRLLSGKQAINAEGVAGGLRDPCNPAAQAQICMDSERAS